jgi:hypothetical protein
MTINQFWPASPTSNSRPRTLVVVVGGPDTVFDSSVTWEAYKALLLDRKVTPFVVGFGSGSLDLDLLTNIAGGNRSNVFTYSNAALMYQSDAQFMWRRVCPPNTNICPGCENKICLFRVLCF